MSELRQQLQSASAAYRKARYPLDLATEVLGITGDASRPLSRRWLIGSVATGAIAAAASVVLLLNTPSISAGSLPTMQAMRNVYLPALPVTAPQLPRYLTVAPPLQRVIPQGIRDLFIGQGQQETPSLEGQMSDSKDAA